MWQMQRSKGTTTWNESMSICEGVLKKRLTKLVDIGNYEFGFCPDRSTTGIILV